MAAMRLALSGKIANTRMVTMGELLKRIEINPAVMAGKPVIRGTRIPVELILEKLAAGISREAILKSYPRLDDKDISAALMFAAQSLHAESYHPLPGQGR